MGNDDDKERLDEIKIRDRMSKIQQGVAELARNVKPEWIEAYLTRRGWRPIEGRRVDVKRYAPPSNSDGFALLTPTVTNLDDYEDVVARMVWILSMVEMRSPFDVLAELVEPGEMPLATQAPPPPPLSSSEPATEPLSDSCLPSFDDTNDGTRLDEIRTRVAAVTPGPWCVHPNGSSVWSGPEYDSDNPSQELIAKTTPYGRRGVDDAEFIANAPADMRWLTMRVIGLQREVAMLWESIDECPACGGLRGLDMEFHHEPNCRLGREHRARHAGIATSFNIACEKGKDLK